MRNDKLTLQSAGDVLSVYELSSVVRFVFFETAFKALKLPQICV